MFYEEWAPLDNKDAEVDKPVLADTSAKMNTDVQHPVIWQKRLLNSDGMRSSAFVAIGFIA